MHGTYSSSATASPTRTDAPIRWPTFDDTIAIAFLMVLFAAACVMPLQSDFWWHLRAGQQMWSSHIVALADTFSFTARGSYWPNHEWLSEVLFYGAYRVLGLPGVTVLAALCVTAAVGLSWYSTRGQSRLKLLLFAAAIPSVVYVWTVRPLVFTLLFVMTTVCLVMRRVYWPLPVLFVVWANLHGGVALGFVVLAASVLAHVRLGDRERARRLGLVSILCFAATFATPLGLNLWRTIPESIHKSMENGIQEWRPPVLSDWRALSFWVFAAATVCVVAVRWRRITTADRAILVFSALGLLPLALRYSRNMTPFVLVAVPALSSLLLGDALPSRSQSRSRSVSNRLLLAFCSIACAAAVWNAWSGRLPRLRWDPVSPAIVQGVRACPGRLYNRFDDGGYLIWFAPNVPVFVDNRQDPYSLPFLQEHLRHEQSGDFESVFARYSLTCAFLPPQSPTARNLLAAGWRVSASDPSWIVLRRN